MQFDFGTIDPLTTSGGALATLLGTFRDALASGHSGASRPSYVQAGQFWISTAASPWQAYYFDGADDIAAGSIDPTNNQFLGPPEPEAIVVSASTADLGAAASRNVKITGSVTITSFGTVAAGTYRRGRFAAALTLTYNATSLILPGAANITTAANDAFGALSLGAGNWLVLWYEPADGQPLINPTGMASLTVEDQALTGGAIVTSKALGTAGVVSSGTVTPDPGARPLQHYTNNGAHTLAPSANAGSCLLDITNGASAGAITTSGFTKVVGDSFTTSNGNKFTCQIKIGNAGSLLSVQAMQ